MFIKNIPNSFATYRTDTNDILTMSGKTVSKDYTVVQNIEAFNFFDSIIEKGEAIIETVGALGNGEIIFITAKLPESVIASNDIINNYLLLTMSHDGTMSIQAMYTPIRVVCNNTLSAALNNNKYKINIKHTLNASEALKIAHNVMGITKKNIELINPIYQQMIKTKIDDKQKMDYFKSVFLTHDEIVKINETSFNDTISQRKKNILNNVMEFSVIGIGQNMDTTKGTVWGAYNAVTGYYHNVKNYKTETSKVMSLLKGDYGSKLNIAFKEATNLIL